MYIRETPLLGAMSSRHLGLYYIIIPSVSSSINMIDL